MYEKKPLNPVSPLHWYTGGTFNFPLYQFRDHTQMAEGKLRLGSTGLHLVKKY